MKKLLSLPLLLALSSSLLLGAEPTPKPSEPSATLTIEAGQPVTVEVGKKCVVEVKTTAKKVTWKIPPEVDYLSIDGKRLAVWAKPGSYKLTAMVPSGDDVLSTEVDLTITGEVGPPTPSLRTDVKTAYDKDPTELIAKAALASKLAKLYRASASTQFLSKYGPTTTWYEVFSDVSTANAAQMGQTDLQGVRVVIQRYLDGKLPTDRKTVLDPKLAATEFGNVAIALEALAK